MGEPTGSLKQATQQTTSTENDGWGSDWSVDFSGTFNILYDVAVVDANTATVVGDTGTILRTTGSGPSPTPTPRATPRPRSRPTPAPRP